MHCIHASIKVKIGVDQTKMKEKSVLDSDIGKLGKDQLLEGFVNYDICFKVYPKGN